MNELKDGLTESFMEMTTDERLNSSVSAELEEGFNAVVALMKRHDADGRN